MASPSIASRSILQSPVARWTQTLAESLFSVLFPSDCRLCGLPLTGISSLPVCQDCLSALHPIAGSVCELCGERLFSAYIAEGETRCGLCQRIRPPFVRALAYGAYEGGLRDLIHLLKYEGVRPAASVLGRMLAEAITVLEPEFTTQSVAVIPVPLYRGKLLQRGFNQAKLIARAALKCLGPDDRFILCTGVLERTRETASQIGLTRHQRRENLRGAFAVARPEQIASRDVLLLDDVVTTGATVSECARVLRRAGAQNVWVATVARTLKANEQHVEIDAGFDPAQPSTLGEEVPMAKAVGI